MADEFVYERCYSDQGPDFVVKYRVIKRTKTRLYVDQEIHDAFSHAYWDTNPEHRRCFTIDRATFERDGSAYAKRKGYRGRFYAIKAAARQ